VDTQNLLQLFAIGLIVLGVIGTFVPVLPGLPVATIGFVMMAYLGNFTRVSVGSTIAIVVIGVTATLIDMVGSVLGAKKAGASPASLIGATIGTVLGIFSGLVGLLFFPFIGAFIGEAMATQDLVKAGKVGVATWLGMLVSAILKIVAIMAMLGIFVLSYFF
jgi:uncharacterized protein YqgC (DUF456 family)